MNARQWLNDYVKRNRRTMTGPQVRAASTTARQIPDDMSVRELADVLLDTMSLDELAPKPIYNVGEKTARYILNILSE